MRIGLDLVEVARIERLSARWGRRFLERVFTPQELDYSLGKKRAPEHLAARFAAKEALIKASGLSSPWRRIEVLNAPSGEPYFSKLPAGLDPKRVRLSLSHDGGVAVAIVLIED
jgi:holo-[acyl-carrier protein] synthase